MKTREERETERRQLRYEAALTWAAAWLWLYNLFLKPFYPE